VTPKTTGHRFVGSSTLEEYLLNGYSQGMRFCRQRPNHDRATLQRAEALWKSDFSLSFV
jgi:hypothetical protein